MSMRSAVPRVSVCIPAYNHAQYVGECIDSVLAQSFQDFEVVITDDASTDSTAEVVSRFRDPRIRLFRNSRNQGPAVTANRNMRAARGELIAFLPSDEAFVPGKLEAQVRFLDSHPAVAAVFGHITVVDEQGHPLDDPDNFYVNVARQPNRTRAEWLRLFFYSGNTLFGSTAMIRRGLTRTVGFHDARLLQLQDFDYWVRVCMRHDIHVLQQPLTRFRVRAGDANTSAPKPAVHTRVLFEFPKVLRRFRKLADMSLFPEVFPEIAAVADAHERQVALGRLAAAMPWAGHQIFGLELLYDALGEASEDAPPFAYPDFFRLVGSTDPYNIARLAEARTENERLRQEVASLRSATAATHTSGSSHTT
jgi:glycosyltransferase involved in cell wall biosynthesis